MPDGATLPGWPRGLNDELAAAYVGLGVTRFRAAMAEAGIRPTWLTRGRRVWLRERLDAWLDSRDPRTAVSADANEWDAAV